MEVIDCLECKHQKNNDIIKKLKLEYSKVLAREKKAQEYLNTATENQFNKWLPAYNNIIKELSKLMF